ncbi:MAG TPA: tRNA preQ1(34) S-adenosylmethionine ribosyltransferase-isomerase QueA [Syntrophorhabdaceae bacterium]|nr:tRNA preQ1(34) S-adenosylmethionine ribosyltransferase-isomerase QueA [Syntrophorhabdaceae bacterium]
MRIEEFDYSLPKEMIAQYPPEDRTRSRLLVFERKHRTMEHRRFSDIIEYLREGDLLVLNNSKVFPARLVGKKQTGGMVEILLVEKTDRDRWLCLAKNVKNGADGLEISIGSHRATLQRQEEAFAVTFLYDGDSDDIVMEYGKMPLPPYIKRNNGNGAYSALDIKRYQTIYAEIKGSIAAPTAGFHFSEELMRTIESKGVEVVKITLHIGTGTFSLMKSHTVEAHRMHREYYDVDETARESIRSAREAGRRVVACGTSAVRTLETVFSGNEHVPLRGSTELFIYPGYRFRMVDALITNFHLPRSTPLALASAFAGRDELLGCYDEAIAQGYRFYSYGDAMLIL